MLKNTTRCDTLRYRTYEKWRATADEDGHFCFAVPL
jgi:hypothetical protein